MKDVREGAVCRVDRCSTQDIPSSTGAERAARQTLSLEVISDAICPWCWVAKHRLDRAIAALGPETAARGVLRFQDDWPRRHKISAHLTTPGRPGARADAPEYVAFHHMHGDGTRNRKTFDQRHRDHQRRDRRQAGTHAA
jgi:hypothetical protein